MTEPKPNPPPNGALRVAILGNIDGRPFVNRFWCDCQMSAQPTAAQVLTLSNAISADYRQQFLPFLTTAIHVTAQRTVLYYSDTLAIGVDGADSGTGSAAQTPVGPAECYLINWSIAGTYRGGHPRTYLPGVAAEQIQPNGILTSAQHSGLTTAAETFRQNVNALNPAPFSAVQLGTIRFFRHNAALAPPVFEPFVAGACNQLVATQRRRVGQ
jgi:hypothetical protein